MNSSMLKTMLDAQEQAYKSAIEVIKEQFNPRISTLENTVTDLTTSLEFTQAEVAELKQKVKTFESEKKRRRKKHMN